MVRSPIQYHFRARSRAKLRRARETPTCSSSHRRSFQRRHSVAAPNNRIACTFSDASRKAAALMDLSLRFSLDMHLFMQSAYAAGARRVKGVRPMVWLLNGAVAVVAGVFRECAGGARPYGGYFQQPHRAGRARSLSRRGRLSGSRHRAHVRREQTEAATRSISPSPA